MPLVRRVRLTRRDQSLHTVLAQRFEEAEALRAAIATLNHDQRLVHQAQQQVHHGCRLDRAPGAHLLSRLEVEPADKDSQAVEERLLGRGEQAVTPVHERSQSLVARKRSTAPVRQEPEALAQPLRDMLRR